MESDTRSRADARSRQETQAPKAPFVGAFSISLRRFPVGLTCEIKRALAHRGLIWYISVYMINAEVQKSGSENALSTIRKFSRRVQGTGLVKTVRANRYYVRSGSKVVKKKRALKLIKRRADFQQLVKEGKVVEAPKRGSFNRESSSPASSTTPTTRS